MFWLQMLCLCVLILTLLMLGIARDWGYNLPEFLMLLGLILYILAEFTYAEPQSIKERAVQLGVGKFIADGKGRVDFYFIVNGKEVKYEGYLRKEK